MMPLTPMLIERRCTAVSSSAEGSTPTWHVCRSRDARCWRLTAKPVRRKRHGNGSRAPYCPKGAVQPHSRVVDFLAAEDVWHHDEPVALEAVNLVLQLESHTACTARQARMGRSTTSPEPGGSLLSQASTRRHSQPPHSRPASGAKCSVGWSCLRQLRAKVSEGEQRPPVHPNARDTLSHFWTWICEDLSAQP